MLPACTAERMVRNMAGGKAAKSFVGDVGADGMVVITDPAKAQIHVIDSTKMQIAHKTAVAGAPFDVVLVDAAGKDQ
jgi:hypothetical protein